MTEGIHPRRHWVRFSFIVGLCCLFQLNGAFAGNSSLHLMLEDDRIWLEADQASLHDVLERFAHLGVRVQMDPAVKGQITAQVGGADLERTLSRLLESHGYVLIWDVLDGPLGQMPRLAEIQVFRPGNANDAAPMFAKSGNFRVLQAGDGSGIEFIADEIVIGFAPGSDTHAIRQLIREIGGTIVESIPELGIYRIRLPPGTNILALVEQLRRNSLVAAVEPNYAYRLPPPATETASRESGQGSVRRPPGGAAPVAVLDSGISHLTELEGFIAGGFNALQPGLDSMDTAGHGTQMALIASGVIAPGGGMANEGVPVLGIRTFDDHGVTSNFAMMRSILHAASEGASVLNLSWGSPVASEFLEVSMAAAHRRGLILVAAAGNEPLNQPIYPAAFDSVIAVGAVLPDGSPWPHSNFGDFITVAAPGTATLPVGYQGGPGSYAGTSIATAYVSYALALYKQRHPNATPAQAIRALEAAVRVGGNARDPHVGAGVLDAAAMERLLR